MESIYEKLDSIEIGKKEKLHTNYGEYYEFIKIGFCEFLLKHIITIDTGQITLTATMTTVNASLIYEKLHK